MDRLISCEFNMDNACVELKFANGSMIAINTIAVENEIADKILFVQCRQDIFVQIAHRWRLRFQLEDALCHIGNDAVIVQIDLVFWYVSGHIPCKIIQHSAPSFNFQNLFSQTICAAQICTLIF